MRARTVFRGSVLAVLLLALGLLVAHFTLAAWGRKRWAESSARFERETGTLDLRALDLPDVRLERNAATWIEKGAAALVLQKVTPDGHDMWSVSAKRPAEWDEKDVAVVRDAIALNRDGLGVLAHARDLDESTFGIPVRDGSAAKLPNLLQIVDAARLVFDRGGLALHDGDRATAISDAALLGSMARALQRERPLIAVIVGLGIERFQLRLVQALIEDPALTPDDLRDVTTEILSGDPRPDYSRAIAAEAAVMCSEFLPLAGGNGVRRQDTVPFGIRLARVIAGDALAASCLDVYRETAASLNAPVLSIRSQVEDSKRRLQSRWGSQLASMLSFPNLINGSERAWLTLELRRLTQAAAILRERAWRDGAYPTGLTGFPPHAAPNPEGAGAWTYEPVPGGAVHLAAPAAAALAEKVFPQGQAAIAPFAWTLPPPRR